MDKIDKKINKILVCPFWKGKRDWDNWVSLKDLLNPKGTKFENK